mgnify:CR=1 FL=1
MTDLNNISKIKQILEVALLTSANPLSLDDLQKLFFEKIGWKPNCKLEEGIKKTYEWVKLQLI